MLDRLTMAGADLLDRIRAQTVWDRMKAIAMERGVGLAFDSIAGLAKLANKQRGLGSSRTACPGGSATACRARGNAPP